MDAFGNLITSLPANALPEEETQLCVKVGDQTISGLTRAFAEEQPGTLIATIDSDGALAVSIVNGSAQERLGVDIGAPVVVNLSPPTPPK